MVGLTARDGEEDDEVVALEGVTADAGEGLASTASRLLGSTSESVPVELSSVLELKLEKGAQNRAFAGTATAGQATASAYLNRD